MVLDRLRDPIMYLPIRIRYYSGILRDLYHYNGIDVDILQVADIQPNIIQSLGEFEKFPWLVAAYAIPGPVLVLTQSKAYALFNIKWLYLGFVVLFEIGSAMSGAAPTINALIVGRMVAGVGGCGMYIGSLTFFSVVTTPKERPMYISLITPVWGIGTVLGPIVSTLPTVVGKPVSLARLAEPLLRAALGGDGVSTSTYSCSSLSRP